MAEFRVGPIEKLKIVRVDGFDIDYLSMKEISRNDAIPSTSGECNSPTDSLGFTPNLNYDEAEMISAGTSENAENIKRVEIKPGSPGSDKANAIVIEDDDDSDDSSCSSSNSTEVIIEVVKESDLEVDFKQRNLKMEVPPFWPKQLREIVEKRNKRYRKGQPLSKLYHPYLDTEAKGKLHFMSCLHCQCSHCFTCNT